jgi:hypothetical protein
MTEQNRVRTVARPRCGLHREVRSRNKTGICRDCLFVLNTAQKAAWTA